MRLKAIITALLALTLFAGPALADTVVVRGSTTVLPIMLKAAEEFMKKNPEINVSVSGGGSGFGVKALLDRSCDIAMASRLVKPKEEKMAQERDIYMVKHEIAQDAIIPVVHPENPIDGISMEELRNIYMGKVKQWSYIGGPDWPVVVISRDTSSGTYETWQDIVLAGNRVFRGAQLHASNGAIVQAVSKNKNTIGYVGIGYVDQNVKALSVDGIEPTRENARDWVYPIVRTLQVYTDGAPKGATKKLIDFMQSPEGQELVVETGFLEME
jgi:phosphate transport system substrate-binding protein